MYAKVTQGWDASLWLRMSLVYMWKSVEQSAGGRTVLCLDLEVNVYIFIASLMNLNEFLISFIF
jgi:hypothetical protein